ncbi:GIY-YIG nuclease family protein [Aspergillus thermomutatus]|uniref:Bacteriophage T5 Orf172 DNA-binding domain-containing protein n=1 Tax=Aspergillus thermomutatus TaxID=41047 RepID=A0A397GZR1_ASPTH|nr:uncharacterized protein CDV56_107178 [Aspergillus thermomutatus]RHZ54896.1 hypothetical protein CDV56_107178 [Aspergillus thermomutatus]
MSDETAPVTPSSNPLYPNLVTPPDSGNSIDNPILVCDSDGSDASDTEAFGGSVRQLSDNSPSPSPRIAARLQPQKIRRHHQDTSPSEGDANVETLEEVENARDLDVTIDDLAYDTPPSSPKLPMDIPNSGTSQEGSDTRATLASTPSASVGPMPIWKLEIKIKEVILKTAAGKEGQRRGHAYIYADPNSEAGYFKLGKTETPRRREKEHQVKCKHPTFELLDIVPRGQKVPWFSRLEALALAELTNMEYSFDCPCLTPHREYFTGRVREGLEILNCWSSWLQRNPYDEKFQLSPFWRDRLRLLGGGSFSHSRCPNTECRSARDICSRSCQACLRLRLKAWTDVTDFDHFQYECRMRVGWELMRQAMYLVWPRFGSRTLILIDGWEKIKLLATFLWAPTTHLYLLLLLHSLLLLVLWRPISVPAEPILCYGIFCLFAYWRIMRGLKDSPDESQLTKDRIRPRTPSKKTIRRSSSSPGPKILPGIVGEAETPDEQEPPSKKRSVSIHGADGISSTPESYQSASNSHEMSEIPRHIGHSPFLTPDRAKRTVGKSSPRAGTKRRKSDVR